MIFQHRETGELYELMIVSLIDMGLTTKLLNHNNEQHGAFALGSFVLHNPVCHDPVKASLSEFHDHFEFFDFVVGGTDES